MMYRGSRLFDFSCSKFLAISTCVMVTFDDVSSTGDSVLVGFANGLLEQNLHCYPP